MPPSRRQLALTTWLAGCSLSARAASRSPRMHRTGIEGCIILLHISHPCGIILSPSAVLCIIRIILILCIIWYYVLFKTLPIVSAQPLGAVAAAPRGEQRRETPKASTGSFRHSGKEIVPASLRLQYSGYPEFYTDVV